MVPTKISVILIMLIPKNLQNINPIPVDTSAPLAWFADCGYFVVNKEIYLHKVYAMQAATRHGLGPKDVIWVFNNDVYDAVDWKQPKNISLQSLYQARARQLREKYNYLALSFSGGGDSTNVLDSFILNNIHLDEVIIGWPRSQTAGKYTPNLSVVGSNFVSEWDYLIEPKLKWLEKVAPKTKITIADPYHSIASEEPQSDIVEVTVSHNLIGYKRQKAIDDILLDRQKTFKNCAIIMGINTPNLFLMKNHLLTFFADATTSRWPSDYTHKGLQRKVEYFYWTPDMPEIPCVQGHALLAALKINKEIKAMVPNFDTGKNLPNSQETGYAEGKIKNLYSEGLRRWVKSVLYPTYDFKLLQVNKTNSSTLSPDWFSWFYDNAHSTEILQSHNSAITSHQNLIDPIFFKNKNGEVHDYHTFQSKFYHLGDLNENIM